MKLEKQFDASSHIFNSESKLKIVKRGLNAEGRYERCKMKFRSYRLTTADAEADILDAFELRFCGG
jgi:hypothetical protein